MDKQMMMQLFEQFLNNPDVGMGFDSPDLYNEPSQVVQTGNIQIQIPEKEKRPLFDRSKFFAQQQQMMAPQATDNYGMPMEQDVGNQEAMMSYSGMV
jgi:hypothetical protein